MKFLRFKDNNGEKNKNNNNNNHHSNIKSGYLENNKVFGLKNDILDYFNQDYDEIIKDVDNSYNLEDIKNNDTSFHQVLGSTFTDTYENKMVNDCAELTLTNKGWKWPTEEFVERHTIDGFIPLTVNEHSGAFYNENYWRFITKKFALNEIHDLTGFFVDIEWNEETPSVNRLTGALDNCVLEVLSGSEELPNKVFQDGNKAVPVMFIANFNEGEGVLYPGKSYSRKNKTSRRITFGRNPQPIDYIYVRVGLPKDSLLSIKNIKVRTDIDC